MSKPDPLLRRPLLKRLGAAQQAHGRCIEGQGTRGSTQGKPAADACAWVHPLHPRLPGALTGRLQSPVKAPTTPTANIASQSQTAIALHSAPVRNASDLTERPRLGEPWTRPLAGHPELLLAQQAPPKATDKFYL